VAITCETQCANVATHHGPRVPQPARSPTTTSQEQRTGASLGGATPVVVVVIKAAENTILLAPCGWLVR
jgi:hypothetical protein